MGDESQISLKAIACQHADAFAARFGQCIDAAQRAACRRAGELVALAASLRDRAMDGAGIDIGELAKVEQLANEAVAALSLPKVPGAVTAIQVELVPSRHEMDATDELKAENERLRQRLAALESGSPNGLETAASVPPSVPNATQPPPVAPAPLPSVVPLRRFF
jgi:hypothetical protein